MRVYDLIMEKKQGGELSAAQIHALVSGYMSGEVKDYQMAAFLMAVCFQGMSVQETFSLTKELRDSGQVLDLSGIAGVKVDKHSTGGVGDKTTLVLLALIAALNVPVAKMAGRGLGHTGGTIDKLDCFPGFSTQLSPEAFIEKVNTHKVAIAGQSDALAPADKKLYALRDVTGTVDSPALIASSVMSKKLAAGCDAIVLDVTYGHGAFMKTKEEALKLAALMVEIGQAAGKKTTAVITGMCEPLGYSVGNALEVKEALSALRGNGPDDLMEVVFALGGQMLLLAGRADTEAEARTRMQSVIESGAALEKMKELITSQGGDAAYVDHPELLPQAPYVTAVLSPRSGFVTDVNALDIGLAAMRLGGGRVTKDSVIDLSVGIVLKKKCGDQVNEGEELAEIHSAGKDIADIIRTVENAYTFREEPAALEPLVYRVIQNVE